jgi:hypothetical protein
MVATSQTRCTRETHGRDPLGRRKLSTTVELTIWYELFSFLFWVWGRRQTQIQTWVVLCVVVLVSGEALLSMPSFLWTAVRGQWLPSHELRWSHRWKAVRGRYPKISPNPHWVSTQVETCKTGRCKILKDPTPSHTCPFSFFKKPITVPDPESKMIRGYVVET